MITSDKDVMVFVSVHPPIHLAVTCDRSVGECDRLSRPSWRLGALQIAILTYLLAGLKKPV